MADLPHPRLVELLLNLPVGSWRSIVMIASSTARKSGEGNMELPFHLERYCDGGTITAAEWTAIQQHLTTARKQTPEYINHRRDYMRKLMRERRSRASDQRAQQ